VGGGQSANEGSILFEWFDVADRQISHIYI
jgi:hypothetical protein